MLRAAELGHTYAMNELGYIFLYGLGEPVDAERGIRFYESGAERDDIYSLNNLGLVYLRGQGRRADPGKALSYFTRAAAGGHPFAPTNLGRMARDGVGGPKDLAAAGEWLELAAERGDYWGALDRARLESDKRVAAKYLALAASLNREGDNFDAQGQAQKLLDKLPEAAVKKALDATGGTPAPGAGSRRHYRNRGARVAQPQPEVRPVLNQTVSHRHNLCGKRRSHDRGVASEIPARPHP